ncbi:Panacea domain-containing protein [Beduini massiliensis]|uniref:Panacea domain-containing protein n=1 Tax=Beduini massiliensis TaxID=1585974 RepID=UPI00059AA8AE|nr:type II toxin-antitoxin system antitoxin SocA domain-containing protein [Beduini massiliensis]
MDQVEHIAAYLYNRYCILYGQKLDEMKLHKLLYLLQREALAFYNRPLFNESLLGWVHGPVSLEVRSVFYRIENFSVPISLQARILIDSVLKQYGNRQSLDLCHLTHMETSWKNSRKSMQKNEIGTAPLKISDIAKDAKKIQPFDTDWGCFFEEHADVDR